MQAVVAGAGSYGMVFVEYLREAGIGVVGFLDDDEGRIGTCVNGVPVLGRCSDLESVAGKFGVDAVFVAIGRGDVRRAIMSRAKECGLETPSFVHRSACVATNAELMDGVYVLQGAQVMPFAKLSSGTIVSMGANVAHHSVIKSGSFLSTGVNVGAAVTVEIDAFLGIGSTVMTGVSRVGTRATVGAGAVVITDVDDEDVVVGVPARSVRKRGE